MAKSRKAEQTSDFILQTVAPIFNKHGYYGTSLSDLTTATGLTKGAIYGNFKNKEELAFSAFKYTVDRIVNQIKTELGVYTNSIDQLNGLTNFYRKYIFYTRDYGGCPIVNIGVDANHQNQELLKRVNEVISKLQFYITKMIQVGLENNEIKKGVDPEKYGRLFFTMIEGAVFMTSTTKQEYYLNEAMDRIDLIVAQELAI